MFKKNEPLQSHTDLCFGKSTSIFSKQDNINLFLFSVCQFYLSEI